MRCYLVALILAVGFVAAFSARAIQAATFFGPSQYFNFLDDSPFIGPSYDYLENETFEDGFLSSAGVSASSGSVAAPGIFTDSVDKDTGSQVIDGSGTSGFSYVANGATSLSFTFSAPPLSGLPTHAGIVWTDVGTVFSGSFGVGEVTFEAFGPGNVSLGGIGPVTLGDGVITGETAEDRFFGVFDAGGISRITISTLNSIDWEVDNLQFGKVQVPEPAAISLAAIALASVLLSQRRR
jgi:hypothetical protein